MKKKYAPAQDMRTANINTTRGMVSFGSSTLWMIRGIDQMMRRIKKGKSERGATRAPEIEEKSGKVVIGRQINAIAQRISQTRSKLVPNLLDGLLITEPSQNTYSCA
jgi:hypothetical protein